MIVLKQNKKVSRRLTFLCYNGIKLRVRRDGV